MTHGIQNNDSLLLSQRGAWHGLGKVVEQAPTIREALTMSGLHWEVGLSPLWTQLRGWKDEGCHEVYDANRQALGNYQAAPGQAITRLDTGEVFATVGNTYQAFQNHELFTLAQELEQGSDGTLKVESAGSIFNGRRVFLLVRTGELQVGIGGGDVSHTYACLSLSHDGSEAIRVFGTSIRVVCNNTLAYATSRDGGRGHKVAHNGKMAENLESVREALRGLAEEDRDHKEQALAMVDRSLTQEEQKDFFLDVYQQAYGRIPGPNTASTDKSLARSRKKAIETVSRWVANMEHENQEIAGIQGTAWAALNAVTQWADHERPVRMGKQHENKEAASTASRLFGPAAAVKRIAQERALALV